MTNTAMLGPTLKDPVKIKNRARKLKTQYDYQSVKKETAKHYYEDGWEFEKELQTKIKLRKEKKHDEKLENRFWALLAKLGYEELNDGRHFKIRIKRKGAGELYKQIDIYAKDEDTVIIGECKSSVRPTRKSLQKDIEEFASLQKPLSNSIRGHYGNEFKPSIIWLFITNNVIWSNPDKERARGSNISIVTEREIRYYQQIAEHLGKAARYQFLAEFLKGKVIKGLDNLKIPAIKGKLGNQHFYTFVSTPRTILKISFVNHRSLNDPEGAPSYQRLVSKTRLKNIGKYLSAGGFFPTNILMNFTGAMRYEAIKKDESTGVQFGYLYMPNKFRSAWIIDGQHRLYGYSNMDDSYLDHNISVIAFEKLSKEDEANMFVTINHEQKTVPKNLLDDLEGELKWGSSRPSERIGAICARLVNILNLDFGEPFYSRLTQQGIPSSEYACLTVPALKDGLRKSGLLGKAVSRKAVYESGALSGINDNDTLDRARSALNSYFGRIKDSAASIWNGGRSSLLCTNVSIQGYILLLKSLISYMEANNGCDAKELSPEEIILEIEEYLDPILSFLSTANHSTMVEKFKVPFGAGGPPEYYYRLCSIIKRKYSDFTPDGMDRWEAEQSKEKISDADSKLKTINVEVQRVLFAILKKKYGEINNAYWERGVLNKEIKTKAYTKSQDDELDERLALENYLDFQDYRKIIENKNHWTLFKPIFDIPDPNETGYSKNLKWMDRINELRRIPAHATESRKYKVDDFEYIDWVAEQLQSRIAGLSAPDESNE